MNTFLVVLKTMMWASIAFALVEAYLKVNKVWKRRHERAVAESQSIMGNVVSILGAVPFMINYFVDEQWEGLFDHFLWVFVSVFLIIVGAGMWVKSEGKSRKFWIMLKAAWKLERDEVGYLAQHFFQPAGSRQILEILTRLALIDNVLEERELRFLKTFAEEWKIPFSPNDLPKEEISDRNLRFIALHDAVQRYLDINPPKDQVAQMRDTVQALLNIDHSISPEEELISAEIRGMLLAFINGSTKCDMYEVNIAPQSKEQERLIREILPKAKRTYSAGGIVFSVDRFFSEHYAEVICEKYRERGLLTFLLKIDNPSAQPREILTED